MQRDEFKILVKAMKAVYSDPKFIPDADAFSVWFEFFKDDDITTLASNISTNIFNLDKFPSSITSICSLVSKTPLKSKNITFI